ncbi:MAG: 50S ribosomal protein L21 [Chlamydiae bacterium]|jgi:large subunit ribosomal protein L21|nr:50S ribosomal protein L21 [Chlamydiota bacterium]MBU6149021.1 50S ribosomal protein L21 [Verrucomicrobiota bacterium]NDE63422.1 50S ribosomal protein L21 [Chlamydiota bacterium]
MYAVIKTGGKQYRVAQGDVIDVELVKADTNGKVHLHDVLLLNESGSIKLGNPTVAGASVEAELVDYVKGEKVVAFKYKRRKNYARKVGHRQKYARIKILQIKKG